MSEFSDTALAEDPRGSAHFGKRKAYGGDRERSANDYEHGRDVEKRVRGAAYEDGYRDQPEPRYEADYRREVHRRSGLLCFSLRGIISHLNGPTTDPF